MVPSNNVRHPPRMREGLPRNIIQTYDWIVLLVIHPGEVPGFPYDTNCGVDVYHERTTDVQRRFWLRFYVPSIMRRGGWGVGYNAQDADTRVKQWCIQQTKSNRRVW